MPQTNPAGALAPTTDRPGNEAARNLLRARQNRLLVEAIGAPAATRPGYQLPRVSPRDGSDAFPPGTRSDAKRLLKRLSADGQTALAEPTPDGKAWVVTLMGLPTPAHAAHAAQSYDTAARRYAGPRDVWS